MADALDVLAKVGETALSVDFSDHIEVTRMLLVAWYVDRDAGGPFSKAARKLIDEVVAYVESSVGMPSGMTKEYVWSLMCRYGYMAGKASSPQKSKIIYDAFFSEFSEDFARDADVAMFRTLVEKLDYNEAVFLAGAWSALEGAGATYGTLRRDPRHADYHIARSLAAKGELFVVAANQINYRIALAISPALGKFITFVRLENEPAIVLKDDDSG